MSVYFEPGLMAQFHFLDQQVNAGRVDCHCQEDDQKLPWVLNQCLVVYDVSHKTQAKKCDKSERPKTHLITSGKVQ
ncbi:MAG: hypothetical protein C3F02_04945 [Parcubacteria group bacterium]|nr:MAG: hypothetical protein C3F02_04945 [Parcubacteria group bacterium]